RMDDRLLQFIQCEDKEPYNIQELIEEYESSLNKATPWTINFESEETEVKNIEELKSWFEDEKLYVGEYVKHKINQLDEPEVLSQKWIDDNKEMYLINDTSENAVPAYKLQNLLVPKQIKPKELYKAITGISLSIEEVCDSSGTETFLGESVSVERIIEEIMKVFESSGSEITEEPETVASVIVDFSRSVTRLKEVMNMEVEE